MRLIRTGTAVVSTRRFTAGFGAVALVLAVSSPAAATPTDLIPEISATEIGFRVDFDPAVAGGEWRLTTHSSPDLAKIVTLATGTVPTKGTVFAKVPLASVLASPHHNYLITAFKPTGKDVGQFAARDIGPSVAELVGGSLLEFGSAEAGAVATNRPMGLPAGTSATCGAVGEQSRSTMVPPSAENPGVQQATPGTTAHQRSAGKPTAGGASASNAPDGGLGTPAAASVKDSCDGSKVVVAANSTQACELMPGGTGSTCVLSSRVLPGQLAFRGNSERSQASLSTFKVNTEATQRWQNGLRYNSGAFSVSGTSSRSNSSGGTDAWPRRGDCFIDDGVQKYIPPCWADGRWRDGGRDTWYWERRQDRYFQSGAVYDYERLFITSYDGGTEYVDFPGRVGYYGQPSGVKAGQHGSWARYSPGSTRETYNQSAVEHGRSVSISVNFPESLGSVTYESSMTHQRLEKVTNFYEFRGDLSAFNHAAPGWPAGQGSWYRYDRGTGWGFEHFSCEFAPGWIPGNDNTKCWTHGS